jgi:hypothetical protein
MKEIPNVKKVALCLLVLCATLAGCVIVPERHWDHDYHQHHEWGDRR